MAGEVEGLGAGMIMGGSLDMMKKNSALSSFWKEGRWALRTVGLDECVSTRRRSLRGRLRCVLYYGLSSLPYTPNYD